MTVFAIGSTPPHFLIISKKPINYLNKSNRKHTNLQSFMKPIWQNRKEKNLRTRFGLNLKFRDCSENIRQDMCGILVKVVAGVMVVMSLGSAYGYDDSWALTEENKLFLEAWRAVDRGYVDKSFNGQNWFRYRENALRSEPMSTREETYMAIRKMLSTLDDPFTRFLEPEKFKSLQSGTQSALTGVGLSIGYSAKYEEALNGLVVISAAPGGPANRAGILPGDMILDINGTSSESMSIYDAAEQLQ